MASTRGAVCRRWRSRAGYEDLVKFADFLQPMETKTTPMEEHHVFFAADSRMSLLETMEQLEPWLDRNNIRPVEFKHMVTPSGSVELQLTFRTREEAGLFERAFCQVEA